MAEQEKPITILSFGIGAGILIYDADDDYITYAWEINGERKQIRKSKVRYNTLFHIIRQKVLSQRFSQDKYIGDKIMKNLMLIKTLLNTQKEIFKQELKEQSELNNYLLQAKSTLDRFEEELSVLESIYIQNNIKNAEKYPQTLKYTGNQLELIQPTANGAYIITSKELSQGVRDNAHTVQALVDFQVKTNQKLSEPINLRRNLFIAENSNKEFGKPGIPMNNEITIKLYNKEYKPNDFDEYTMSFKNLKSGLGIVDEVNYTYLKK